jgi:predicted nucleotidyltransferase
MTVEELKNSKLILLDCISGSKAYGLDTPSSDTDFKGVFLLPKPDFYGLNYIPQISNKSNDIVYYELGRFMELLAVNNPNILELLNTPKAAVLYKHPFLEALKPNIFLSKLCKNTFGKFALSQIKKARGLKKKIVNPFPKEKKTLLDFCYVNFKNGSIPLLQYLELNDWKQADCGLTNIPHMENVFGLYHGKNLGFKGIIRTEHSNDLSLSSIPKDLPQAALLYFNRNGYSIYCKDYKAYWNWVAMRNEERFNNTKNHGKNYDSKNMMHTFRLLEMAIEIAKEHRINVKRKDRTFLLDIKAGKFEFDDLLRLAEKKQLELEKAFEKSTLPDTPNLHKIKALTVDLREKLYQ